jgi:RNA polymerase sigma factor (sigma-70 family)
MTDNRMREMWLGGQRNELATQLKGIPVTIAEKLYTQSMIGTELELDDVVSWALESMWKAIESWDPDKGVPLRGWVAFRVERDIKNVQRDAQRQKRGGGWDRVPMAYVEDRGAGPDCGEHDTDTNNKLAHSMIETRIEEGKASAAIDAEKALESLPEQQQQVLRGLATGASLREIGVAMGISYEWVRKLAEKARAHLRECLS